MAKQTFTTGQVLTAAQMTSLQQTAMGGGSTTAKTTSYVLTAADAGTVVQMNAAGATTITVNTGLFAAGDTVQIQNIGAGVCTVTAGTATVNTVGSLALSQYAGGDLYFNTTGAAFLYGVDSAAASGGGMTVLASGSLSGAALSLSSISGSYNDLQLVLRDFYPSSAAGISMVVNSISDYNIIRNKLVAGTITQDGYTANSAFSITYDNNINTADNNSSAIIDISDYASSVNKNIRTTVSYTNSTPAKVYNTVIGNAVMGAAVTSITVNLSVGNFSGGTYILYGVK